MSDMENPNCWCALTVFFKVPFGTDEFRESFQSLLDMPTTNAFYFLRVTCPISI